MSSVQEKAELLMSDPIALFDGSITNMHSIEREELAEWQKAALNMRFREHYDSIEVLRKLADRQGVSDPREFNDLAPLFFAHTAFKSYPASLLSGKRFDLLVKWLDKQTPVDLSGVQMEGCGGLREFLDRMDEQTEINLLTSSGTTGTMSLIPKLTAQSDYGMRLWHMNMFQTYGEAPTDALQNTTVDIVWPTFSKGTVGAVRSLPQMIKYFCAGDESRLHPLYDYGIDPDLLVLASQMRLAAAKGELDRLKIEPEMLKRKEEFEAQQAKLPEDMSRFLADITEKLAGQQVFMVGSYPQLYQMAIEGLERGVTKVFSPDSAILTGGGMKGAVLPDNYLEVILEFLGIEQLKKGYGFSEGGAFHWRCEHNRYHCEPFVIPFLLDPDTSEPLPREGVVTGRGAFYNLLEQGHWGGVITGDEVTIDWDTPCPCGRTSVHMPDNIIRYSEKENADDDRINCNANQSFAEEAVDFMNEYMD